ncbi:MULTISPECIES: type VI secretion system contractile sheath large subunit [unclassified Bartonella]|uniref:type VI secretion system contractile sheath large subunit n=1 Tax=unclassified Bartonella TaxID=2645622 RepID=UPI0021C9749F|nr:MULTISPECIES: type VI secretion system contractile sheath large subunit [unclassified Bartonella]UXN05083.1 type VI secretion system contractile sheath large subunit [Bartonella sp. HY406]UXN08096.1 type VI secretion system contractile sheath large subunit [Bartonella sp. HY761]
MTAAKAHGSEETNAKSLIVTDGSLLDQLLEQTTYKKDQEEYDIAKKGVEVLINDLLKSKNVNEKVNKNTVDRMIAELDRKISQQVDQILHHKKFQQLEAAWRGLKFVVDRTDFRENIKFDLLSASKEELLEDFDQAPEVVQSGLYKHIYSAHYGQFGGEPVGAMIANYNFGPSAPDIKLMQYVSSVGAMAHAPFIAGASPEMYGINSNIDLPAVKELASVYDSPRFRKWNAFRESEDARYVGLTGPRFLLRQPYDPLDNPVRNFVYTEDVASEHENYLWGNTSFALATRLVESFEKYRFCANIIGPQSGGAVHDLPVHLFESLGQLDAKIPTEVLITDRRELEMAEQGFIALTMRKGSDNAAFFSANSVQAPKRFPNTREGKQAETNYKLGTQLPYIMIINRLAHYLKVLQREQLGSWKEREDLERELNVWLKQYVADQENPPSEVRSKRPLRSASVDVSDVAGDPGWYQVALKVRPHFKYMGANFELSLVGKLEKSTTESD